MSRVDQEIVALIPAAGRALRIAPLPCSKELYPVGFRSVDEGHGLRPKVACHYLLEKMHAAGITKAYIVLLQGKWDIPAYFNDGAISGLDIAYRVIRDSPSVQHTLDCAYPFVQNALISFGFPDILFRSRDAYARLLARQRETKADVVLGMFPTDEPENGIWSSSMIAVGSQA